LIVDDDFEIFTHSALTTKRRVNFAFNGIEALEVLKNNTTIDILMDIMIEMDGFEATRKSEKIQNGRTSRLLRLQQRQ
jgi:CheY-like chemotaxis protein